MIKVVYAVCLLSIVALGLIVTQAGSDSRLIPDKDFDKLPAFRFLWPGGTGSDAVELSGKFKGIEEAQTPFGNRKAANIEWVNEAGENVASSRIIYFPKKGFDSYVFETKINVDITAPTGDYFNPITAIPAIKTPESLDKMFTYQVKPFSKPSHEPVATTGPVVLYNNDLEVMMISPLDNFMAAMQAPVDGEWRSGFGGLIEKIPAGTIHRVLLVNGSGIFDTFMRWGDFVRGWYHHPRPPFDADVGLKYLGYWTDNGAYYYYKAAPDMNYHQTLMAVKKDADDLGIPYGYFQIDSWWYPKAKSNSILGAFRGGALLWEPIPEMFPKGLNQFQKELGLPLVAHNRWYDKTSPYCERYQCVYGVGDKTSALPIDPAFWDEIMDNALSYGVEVYEQDWLATQMNMIPYLRSGFDHSEKWFDSMLSSAKQHNLTMQLCMASPEFFLQQVKHRVATQVRCSDDYIARIPKRFYWPAFHKTSMFAYAVGMWPFKDNFQSSPGQRFVRSEKWPFEEALISTLSAGVVGPGDKIGAADKYLLNRTCRKDGVLLKPDRPAMPIDLMYINRAKPWIVTTESKHDIGTTTYLAAFNIWPKKMKEPHVSMKELGISGKYMVYNWRHKDVKMDIDRIDFGRMPKNDAFYYMICPVLDNGMAVVGEAGKLVPLSTVRFEKIEYKEGRLTIDMKGVPGEILEVSIYFERPPESVTGGEFNLPRRACPCVIDIPVTIDESGKAQLIIE